MTAEQKKQLAHFFDVAGDYLRDGYRRFREEYRFADDAPREQSLPARPLRAEPQAVSKLDPQDSLEKIAGEISLCAKCALRATRAQTVPGDGVKRPLVVVVGEGPGAEEDASGKPFVGKAGQLLDKMIGSINLSRTRNCFITNIVKCRPPNNRDPLPEETASCAEYLKRQIARLKPAAILCAGRIAAQNLLNSGEGIGKLRGILTEYAGIPLIATYHPSAILRNEDLKRPVWEDLKLLRAKLIELDEHYALEIREGI
ncbi:MAG: uracil-DNA glycosylase [Spirochaetaceae bacterium]|jgi:DNA polymerase|nr:uracil-DNA glycosylase [Spirochaetaceae bacterium]